MSRFLYAVRSGVKKIIRPGDFEVMRRLPPRMNVVIGYLCAHGRLPDLKNPRSFNEKVVWRKLYDHDPRLPDLVDKIKVKEIMAKRFGEDFVIPTLAVYDRVEDMDFSGPPLSLPPYVLKPNHGAKMNVFVRDRNFNAAEIKKQLASYLQEDHGAMRQEWAYSQVERKILVEPYIDTKEGLTDYKFHVFSGKVFMGEIIVGRFNDNLRYNILHADGQVFDGIYYAGWKRDKSTSPPPEYARMVEIAEDIGKDFSYVRVDLYLIAGKITFGEVTFYPSAGHDVFSPRDWDYKIGEQWNLSRAQPDR